MRSAEASSRLISELTVWSRGPRWGGGLPHPVQVRVDKREELASGAVVAREAAEQRLDQIVHEPREDARRLGRVEVGDLVAPAFASDLFQRRF